MEANEAFEDWYISRFGERWQSLRESLLVPAVPEAYSSGLKKPYFLDRASLLAALSLRLPEQGLVLDACAAPGGKSLVLASRMEPGVKLICNELSSDRRRRLSAVLDAHLDQEKRGQLVVSGFNTAALGGRKQEHNRFDAVLLDAPCSSERHVIQNNKALSEWKPARPKFLAQRQWALLSAAFLLLKPGASLVYSTCALSTEENDQVISRLFDKYGSEFVIDPPDFTEGEPTKYGRLILPDADNGMGPMYVARINKNLE